MLPVRFQGVESRQRQPRLLASHVGKAQKRRNALRFQNTIHPSAQRKHFCLGRVLANGDPFGRAKVIPLNVR